jgi:3-isopropylmalate/(R)-2-methylmalate dehydratase small subunit
MEKFEQHCGVAAPLLRTNIDTDTIIPSREMKRVSKHGLSDGLFAGWRYREPDSRELDPGFILNQQAFEDVSILLAGANFGCGSSREHAVWALAEYGIRAIIAPSFGTIFAGNCERNGLLPVILDAAVVLKISDWVSENPVDHRLNIDLVRQTVQSAGISYPFDIDPGSRRMLVDGLDAIGLTQTRLPQIMEFHKERKKLRPWLYQ